MCCLNVASGFARDRDLRAGDIGPVEDRVKRIQAVGQGASSDNALTDQNRRCRALCVPVVTSDGSQGQGVATFDVEE